MRLLMIGGTQFVGRHVVERAVAAGHEVTVFHRGVSEPADLPAVEHVHGERDGGLDALAGRTWDAVIDVCGYAPRIVRLSANALAGSVGRYCFISSESVYAEPFPPVVTEDAPLATLGAAQGEWSWYGPLKVLCERVVETEFGDRALVVRPGYVVGPHDSTDRFTSWVRRASLGGSMLGPGNGEDVFQFVDGRDLGAFVVGLLEREASGAFNADGEPISLAAFLAESARVAGTDTRVVWVAEERVRELHLEELFPMWEGGDFGRIVMDASKGRAAGLANRPAEETIVDTLAWDRDRGLPPLKAGPTPEHEARLLQELG
jgi:2'-hydroxyisoflavone reductase